METTLEDVARAVALAVTDYVSALSSRASSMVQTERSRALDGALVELQRIVAATPTENDILDALTVGFVVDGERLRGAMPAEVVREVYRRKRAGLPV